MLGDEYSTIARLTEYKHDHQSHTNNNSMVDTSMYSVQRMDVDTSMFSLSGADATPARKESQVCSVKLCVWVAVCNLQIFFSNAAHNMALVLNISFAYPTGLSLFPPNTAP